MIIVCDSCGTRFHLADGRIGPQGAKVRCSNCHHRFHVTRPASDAGAPPPPRENSPPDVTARISAADSARGRKPLGDPDLDNPRFLFDEQDAAGGTSFPEGVPFAGGEISQSDEITQMHESEDDATPAPGRAATPLMGMDPDVSARQLELNREAGVAPAPPSAQAPAGDLDSLFDFDREEDFEATPVPGREPNLGAAAEPRRAQAPLPPAASGSPGAVDLAGDDVEEAIDHWDVPMHPTAARRVEVLRPPSARVPGARVPRPAAAASAVSPPDGRGAEQILAGDGNPPWFRLLVALAAAILILATLRQSLPAVEPFSAPVTTWQGWSTRHVHARAVRDLAGDPILEIEGELYGPLGGALPRVRVSAVDPDGQPVVAAVEARVASFAAAPEGPAPDVLPAGSPEQPVAVFVADLPEASADADQLRLELQAPAKPPAPAPEAPLTTARPGTEIPPPEAVERPQASAPSAPAAPQP